MIYFLNYLCQLKKFMIIQYFTNKAIEILDNYLIGTHFIVYSFCWTVRELKVFS